MNCECQEFTADQSHGGTNTKLEMVKILPEAAGGLPKAPSISHEGNPHIPVYHFMWANCENISFKKIDLSRFDFRGAINVNMVGGYIADTTRSPLGVVGTTLFDYIDCGNKRILIASGFVFQHGMTTNFHYRKPRSAMPTAFLSEPSILAPTRSRREMPDR